MFAFIANFCLVLLLGGLNSYAYSGGHDGDSCNCHGSETSSTTIITANGLPNATYTPGQIYDVTVSVSDAGLTSTEGGIYVSIDQGSLATTDPNLQLIDSGDPKALMHSSKSAVSWTFTWTAPNASVWVNIKIVAMVADGSGTGGDLWNSLDRQINAEGSTNTSAPPPPPTKTLPDYEEDIIVAAVLSTALLVILLASLIFFDRLRRRNRG
ncbi:MAG: choice-of-anchor V domain-containing protein [Candidatus Thorarchaeota archaeon]